MHNLSPTASSSSFAALPPVAAAGPRANAGPASETGFSRSLDRVQTAPEPQAKPAHSAHRGSGGETAAPGDETAAAESKASLDPLGSMQRTAAARQAALRSASKSAQAAEQAPPNAAGKSAKAGRDALPAENVGCDAEVPVEVQALIPGERPETGPLAVPKPDASRPAHAADDPASAAAAIASSAALGAGLAGLAPARLPPVADDADKNPKNSRFGTLPPTREGDKAAPTPLPFTDDFGVKGAPLLPPAGADASSKGAPVTPPSAKRLLPMPAVEARDANPQTLPPVAVAASGLSGDSGGTNPALLAAAAASTAAGLPLPPTGEPRTDGATAQAALSARPGSSEFAPQLGVQVAVWAKDGVQRASLQLNPLELGPVSVQIQLDGNGAQVSLAADLAATRLALEQALPSLASSLREAGLTLTGGGVFDQARQQAGADGNGNGTNTAAESRRTLPAQEAERAERLTMATPRRRGVVDLMA